MTSRQEKIKDIYQSILVSLEKTVVAKILCYMEKALGGFEQNIASIAFLCFLHSLSSWEIAGLL